MSSSSKKDGNEKRDSLVDQVFSWSLHDIFNHNLYKDKVNKIPKTFSSVNQYLDSYRYPLLEETHADFLSNMMNLYKAPKCKILSVEKHKHYKPPRNFIYTMLLDHMGEDGTPDKNVYKPQGSDIIAFSDVRPERVKDFVRVSYIPAMILGVDDEEIPYLVKVLTSKPIIVEDENGEENLINDPLFAVYLINMTTNLRIWRALHPSGARNENIIKEALRANSQAEVDCNICSQEAELVLSKGLQSFNLNESQFGAVLRSIATSSCSHKNSVKLIWGPPGTGKTKTIGILLWALLKMKCKALTCAPTNTAVVEVTRRLMSIVGETLESNNYGLGDIVLFGNDKRMNIDARGDLGDVFLDYRSKILWDCLNPRTGWGVQLKSMICLLEEAYQQFLVYGENKKLEKEKDVSCKMEQMEEIEEETVGLSVTVGQSGESSTGEEAVNEEFSEFLLKRFSLIEKDMRFSIESISSHMPTSFISVTMVNKMYTTLDLLKFFRVSLVKDSYSNQELKKVFSDSEIKDCSSKTTSVLLLRKSRVECLEVLRFLEEFKFPNFHDVGSIKEFCLQKACLIFCTASSSAKLSTIKELKLVIIDEAAQLKECESAIPLQLTYVRHAILIGDERQLPAMVQSKISEKAEFGRSLFERLVSLGQNKHLLNIQYRMHPSISVFPNVEFYNKQILDAPTVKGRTYTRNLLQGRMYGPFSFIDVSYGKEEFNDMHSCRNPVEVAVISAIIENLYKASIANNNKVSVGVISPYKAQVFALIDKLGNRFEAHSNFSVSVRSVDGFQGAEEDVIIMSTVRSNGNGSVGFLSNHQRTNVALTRARYCLWVVGNGQTLMNSDSVWRKLVQSSKDRGCFFRVDDDKMLSKAVIDSLIELNQLEDLLNMDSLLFKGAKWKVIFGDGFWSSLSGIKSVEFRKNLVSLLMKLSSGWRQRSQKEKELKTNDGDVAQLLQRNQINGRLNLLWTTDIVKEKSNYIQVLKILDILPSAEIPPRLAKSLDAIFQSYTVQKMCRCKHKRLEGVLEVPMSWEISPDDTIGAGTNYEDLSAALASLNLAKEHIPKSHGSRGQSSRASKPRGFRNKATSKQEWHVV
ncbi:helicase SEN1-like [Papaver somniferum]|nr:helicase SEN1-like [Papaver somniferum]